MLNVMLPMIKPVTLMYSLKHSYCVECASCVVQSHGPSLSQSQSFYSLYTLLVTIAVLQNTVY